MKQVIDRKIQCDYQVSPKCDGTLKGRKGTIHKVYTTPRNTTKAIYVQKYACIDCEMCFDSE